MCSLRNFVAIVDDNFHLRSILVSVLRAHGYQAIGFESAESFLDHPSCKNFNALVTDYQMPGMSGVELIKKIVGEKWCCPCILMSGAFTSDLESSAIDAGCLAILAKPFPFEKLNAILSSCLKY